jgi:tetratricopeptide (TPR) repeat protein
MKKNTLFAVALPVLALLLFENPSSGSRKVYSADSDPIKSPMCTGNLKVSDLVTIVDTSKARPVIFSGLGDHHFKVSTRNAAAQKFFDQGLALYYAFNHAEAYRSFNEASRLDPACAMAFWGEALCLGPNINAPMDASDATVVFNAIQKAVFLAPRSTEKEQAYIIALSKRYVANPPENRAPLDSAYTNAMKKVVTKYPADLDAASLYAEALMDLSPWNFWMKDGSPQPWTPEILEMLESVLKKDSDHVGANHFYIHVVEASETAERAMSSAKRLETLLPAAGHLVHMPSHIYIRTGRYHEGSVTNEASVKADQAYLNQCNSQGLYALVYHPHNYHFLWACTTLEGRGKYAVEVAKTLGSKQDASMMVSPFGFQVQHFSVTPIFAMVRFGRWDDLLEIPEPDKKAIYARAMWHYGRGVAYARQGMTDKAEDQRLALLPLLNDTTLNSISVGALNTPYALIEIAEKIIRAEIYVALRNYDKAIPAFMEAVDLEDKLNYSEPADWHQPVRQILGAVLLEKGDAKAAEKVYLEDLKTYPDNGWSLYGLQRCLLKQGRKEEAMQVKKRFDKAFAYADIKLVSSRF